MRSNRLRHYAYKECLYRCPHCAICDPENRGVERKAKAKERMLERLALIEMLDLRGDYRGEDNDG